MYRAYIDESSSCPDGSTFAVGGFWGKARTWMRLERPWLKLMPENIQYFHATECFNGSGQFEGVGIDKREQLLDSLTDLIVKRQLTLFAVSIDVPAYEQYAPRPKINDFGTNKYVTCLESVVELACNWSGGPPQEIDPRPDGRHDTCAFVIEANEYSVHARKALQNLRSDVSHWWTSRIGTETYGTKNGAGAIPLLQVADLGAFLSAKIAADVKDTRLSWRKYYDKLKTARRIGRITRWDETSLKIVYDLHQNLALTPTSLSGFLGDVTESLP